MSSPPVYPKRPIDPSKLIAPGLPRFLFRFIQPLFEWFFDIRGANALYRRAHHGTVNQFTTSLLQDLNVDFSLPNESHINQLRQINGPLMVCANHPTGGTDAFALIQLLEKIRPGNWKLMANEILSSMPELAPHLIAVNVMGNGTQQNKSAMMDAYKFLRSGGLLAVFPAGRVSDLHPSEARTIDSEWSAHLPKLATKSAAQVALIHINAHNSDRFYRIPTHWTLYRALCLSRELTHPSCKMIHLSLKAILPSDATHQSSSWHFLTHSEPTPLSP